MSTSHEKRNLKDFYTLDNQRVEPEKVKVLLAPVMIVGSPRSGTTWLQKLLLENPQVCGGQESHFYSLFNESFLSVSLVENDRRVGLSQYWKPEEFNKQMRELWLRTFMPVFENRPEAIVLLEKTPSHALFIDDITSFLPKTKFIHIIRDSRSVTASLNATAAGWGSTWAPNSTKGSALEWYRHVSKARESVVAKNKTSYLEVHYEDLLADTTGEMLKIYRFMEVDYDSGSLNMDIDKQSFSNSLKGGGVGIKAITGEELKEPDGFIRKGRSDSWKTDLNWYQKLVVWRYTRKLMHECGYDWRGRIKN